jgi:REP element-mobilizing transposase RayT
VVREICDEYGFEITDMEVAENHIYISWYRFLRGGPSER